MTVSADDNIDIAARAKRLSQLFILFKPDVRQKNGHINIGCLIGVRDLADFLCSSSDVDQGSDRFFRFCLWQNILRYYPDEQDLQAACFQNDMRSEKA